MRKDTFMIITWVFAFLCPVFTPSFTLMFLYRAYLPPLFAAVPISKEFVPAYGSILYPCLVQINHSDAIP